MTRRVLLVEIGTPAELPVVTPPAPRPPSNWVPDPRPSPGLPPPTGLAVASIADAAVLTWTPSPAGGQTIIESAPNMGGAPGVWREAGRTGADSYTLSLPDGARWVRVRAELNGRTSAASAGVLAVPVAIPGSISEFEQELQDIADQVDAVAAQAAADAAALADRADALRDDIDDEIARAQAAEGALGTRADGLRTDIDGAIADLSTLEDATDVLATEINRVESESVTRDSATASTLALLGATNGAGTAFILDGSTVRVAPDQSLAQWRSSVQSSLGDANARIDAEETARANADTALATRATAMESRMPTGTGKLATAASVTTESTTRAAADTALATRATAMEARMPSGTGPLATAASVTNEATTRATADTAMASDIALMGARNAQGTAFILNANTTRVSPTETLAQWRASLQADFGNVNARIDAEETARADGDSALATTLATVQATADNAATKAELTNAQSTLAAADQALAERIDLTEASLGQAVTVDNPSFEQPGGWTDQNNNPLPAHVYRTSSAAYQGSYELRFDAGASVVIKNTRDTPVAPTQRVRVQVRTRSPSATPAGTEARVGLRVHSTTGAVMGNYYVDTKVSTGATWTYANGIVSGELVLPAGAAYAYAILYCSGMSSGSICFDMVEFAPFDAAANATAQALASTNVQVQQNSDGLASQGTQISTLTGQVAEKADFSYVQAVEGTANTAGNNASSALSQVTSLSASVGSNTASITQLSEVTGAANLTNLINAGFETEDGWSASASGGPLPSGVGYSTTGQPRTGTRTMRFFNNGTIFNLGRTPVTAGELLTFGGWVRAWGTAPPAGARFHVGIRHRDAYGSFMSGQNVAATVNGTGGIFGYQEAVLTYAVPAGAAHVEMYIIVEGMSVGSVQWDDMYIERVGRAEAEMRAKYSLAVTAGGDVAGMQLLAGGGTSAIRFLADMFSVIDPSGGSRLEWSDGAIRVYDGSQMRVRLGRLS